MVIMGHVARILSDHEIVINVGREHGVEEGMQFVIFSDSERIFDPQTGEDLGPLEIIKGRVKVFHVQEKISRARTETYEVEVPALDETLSGSPFLRPRREIRRQKLKVDEPAITPIKEEYTVRVGDKARSVGG